MLETIYKSAKKEVEKVQEQVLSNNNIIKTMLRNVPVVGISAERTDKNKAQNLALTNQLKKDIEENNLVYVPSRGGYIENLGTDAEKRVDGERSFIVFYTKETMERMSFNEFTQLMVDLMVKYNQEEILITEYKNYSGGGFLDQFYNYTHLGSLHMNKKSKHYTRINDFYFTFGNEEDFANVGQSD